MLQSEIAELRRQSVLLRGALAEVVTMPDIGKARAYALKILTDLPAYPPAPRRPAAAPNDTGDGATDAIGDGDVGAAGRSSGG